MEDENLKNAKKAADMAVLQNKMKDLQEKTVALQNKEYQGKFQGVTIRMKGDHQVIDVRIDQGYYETAGKGQLEKAFFQLLNNLVRAIKEEQEMLTMEFQKDMERLQRGALDGTDPND